MDTIHYQLDHFNCYYNNGLDRFIDSLETFCALLNKSDDKTKKLFILTHICDETYKMLSVVCHPDKPKDKSYADIVHLLRSFEHVKRPTDSVFSERRKFYLEKQKEAETIAQWSERVRELAMKCKFCNGYDDIFRDRFISGLNNVQMQELFFDENHTQLTYERAVRISRHREIFLNEQKEKK